MLTGSWQPFIASNHAWNYGKQEHQQIGSFLTTTCSAQIHLHVNNQE
jgi:hypothetical protein